MFDSTLMKHDWLSSYPPLMKSTNVYSDSTLKDSRVTLKIGRKWKGNEEKYQENQERQANSKHYTFTGLINHSCYESSPWNMWQLLTWHSDESYRPWVDVFLLFAFLFRIQHLDHKRGNMKQAFQQTSQNTLYSLSSYF